METELPKDSMPSKRIPLVSVCIPVYNGERYIEEALNSAISQTYPNIEIIVSDNDSDDNTLEIANSFLRKSSVNFLILSHPQYGLVNNWNFCISHAKGKYIKFLCHDDLLEPNCIEEMVNLAEQDDEIGLVFSPRKLLLIEDTTGIIKDNYKILENMYTYWSCLKPIQNGQDLLNDPNLFNYSTNKIGEPSTVLIKKEVFEKVGLFDIELLQAIDLEMWFRIMSQFKIGFVNKVLSYFRIHPEQLTQKNIKNNLLMVDLIMFYQKIYTNKCYPNNARMKAFQLFNALIPKNFGLDKRISPKSFNIDDISFEKDIKKIKVLFDISVLGQSHYNNLSRTGVFRVVENIANGLSVSEDIKLSFCANLSGIFQPCQDYLKSHPKLQNIPLYQSNISDVDIFHSPFYPLPNDVTKAQRFLTVYDLIPIKFPNFFPPNHNHLQDHTLKSLKLNDWAICISHSTKNDLCNHTGIKPDRVFVSHLAADPTFFCQCTDSMLIASVRKKYGIPDAQYLLSVSTLEPRKNIDHVIRCFAKIVLEQGLKDLYLVLVGTKGWSYDKIFNEISNQPFLRERIILTGYVPDQDLAPLYSGALAFVYPSLYEGFGLPPLEAMQCGTPVITSNTSSLPEVIGDAGIMLAPKDVDGLCDSIFQIYNNVSMRTGMSLKSLEQAKKFSWNRCVQETIAAYKMALSEKSSSPKAVIQNQPLKLLIDGVMFQIHKSGITRIWESLFREWSANGFSNHILVLDRAGTAPKIEGVRYRTIPPYDYNNTDADRQMLQQVCNEENATFFISSYYTTPVSTPSVFMAYDMIPEMTGANLASQMWREKHYGIYHAASYISISENTARDLARCFPYISQDAVSVAYCGIEEHFKPAGSEEIAQFKVKYGISKPYFLLVGDRIGFNGYKNAILFFRAFQMLDNKHELEIVCVSRAALEPDFAPYISGSKLHVLTLSDDDLRIAYSGAIALAYPSKYEGFGLPIAEAMSCECPVITCKNASIPEVAGNAALYVNENDVDGLLNLLKTVQMPETRKTLISAGLEQVKKFSWRKMADIVASKFLSLSERFSAEESAKRPLYVNWLKTCADNFRRNPSDQACLEFLRKERRKIAEIFVNTSQEKIGTVYQTYIGNAYNILLSKGIQSVPLREDEQAFIANVMSSVQTENVPNTLESLLSNAYMPLINSMGTSVSLEGKEELFVGNLISFAQKGQYHPQTLSWVLAAMLFLTLDIRRG